MSTAHLTKADGTNRPVGELANYSIDVSAIPISPANTEGQIPTFSTTVVDIKGDPKTLVDSEVTLTDWTGRPTSGRVVSASRGGNSKAASLDSNTMFERLNTVQTVAPVVFQSAGSNAPGSVLAEWMLAAGVTDYKLDSNLYMAIENPTMDGIGYLAEPINKLRFYGPPTTWRAFVPTNSKYCAPIEVNPSQDAVLIGTFYGDITLQEFRIHAFVNTLQQNVIYTVRRNHSTWTLREKVGSAAETVLISATYTPVQQFEVAFVFVKIAADALAGKVDITMRIMEQDPTTLVTSYTDFTANAVTSTLRNRPLPYEFQLGYDPALTAGHDPVFGLGMPDTMYITDGMQDTYPVDIKGGFLEQNAASDAKAPHYIPGFTGNVWDAMREFCSLLAIDIYFVGDKLYTRSRILDDIAPAQSLIKSGLSENAANRETARSVEVLWREMDGLETNYNNTLLWKADTVYSIEKGETKEEIVQTDSTFVFLNQPVPVGGVPVPYNSAFGSYVITGNDGFIVDPQWWSDNGGSIKVEMTEKAGEIKLIMQAPTVDTTRAPYRVSEGVADRPALYILGRGLKLTPPKTLKVYTGAKSALDVGITYDSIFMTKKLMALNAGHKLAAVYGTASSEISFKVNQGDYTQPSSVYDVPVNNPVYHDGSYYRITSQTTLPGSFDIGKAERHNTIGVINNEFATGKTIADWNALHAGKLIRDVTISPLPKYES